MNTEERPAPEYPDLPKGTWVKLLPRELKGIEGKVLWKNASGDAYAVQVPYGEDDGALIYVHLTDVKPIREVGEPREPYPIARIADDIITRHLAMLGLVDLKKLISDTWADYNGLPSEDQYNVLLCVARRIYGRGGV